MHFSAGCRRGEGQVSGLTLGFLGRVYFPFSLQILCFVPQPSGTSTGNSWSGVIYYVIGL